MRAILDCETKFKNKTRFEDPAEIAACGRIMFGCWPNDSPQARRFPWTGESLIKLIISEAASNVKPKMAQKNFSAF